jgi:hypothetical protein
MINKQEVASVSNSTRDAPSLIAIRTLGRALKLSKKLREIKSSNTAKVPLTKVRRTKKES